MTLRTSQLLPLPALVAAATLALAGCAAAEDSAPTAEYSTPVTAADSTGPAGDSAGPATKGTRRGRPNTPEEMIQRFDRNGDGQLQLAELPERARARIGEADANSDGVLTRDEIAQGMEQRRAERFAKVDQDGDGKLTAAEAGERWWSRLRMADTDGDGAVTRAELELAHQQGKLGPANGSRDGTGPKGDRGAKGDRGGWGDRGQPGSRMFDRSDTNGDGKLEQSEVPPRMWSHISVADANGDGAVTREELEQAHADGTLRPPPGRGQGSGGPGDRGPRAR